MKDKIFLKEWDSENKMRINFIRGNGSLIKIEMKKNSPYETEMDELSKMLSNRRLDDLMLQVLKDKGFKEQN